VRHLFADCKFNCHKKCAALVPKDCQGYAGYISTPSSEYFYVSGLLEA